MKCRLLTSPGAGLWLAHSLLLALVCGCGESSPAPVEHDEAVVLELPPEDDSPPTPRASPRTTDSSRPTRPAPSDTPASSPASRPPRSAVAGYPPLRPGDSLRLRRVVTQAIEQTDEQGPAGSATARSEYDLDLLCEGDTVPPQSAADSTTADQSLAHQPPANPATSPAAASPETARQLRLTIQLVHQTVNWPELTADVPSNQSPPTQSPPTQSPPAPLQSPPETPPQTPPQPLQVRFWLSPAGEVVAVQRLAPTAPAPSANPQTPAPLRRVSDAHPADPDAGPSLAAPPGGVDPLQHDPAGWLADWLCLVPTPPGQTPAPWREIRDVTAPVPCRKTTEYRSQPQPGTRTLVEWRARLAPPGIRLASGSAGSDWQLLGGEETGELLRASPTDWPGEVTQQQIWKLKTHLDDQRPVWQTKRVRITLKKRP